MLFYLRVDAPSKKTASSGWGSATSRDYGRKSIFINRMAIIFKVAVILFNQLKPGFGFEVLMRGSTCKF